MKEQFTRQEVINILVSVFVFANANTTEEEIRNQIKYRTGLNAIIGTNYGQKAETILKAHDSHKSENTILSIISKFK